MSMYDWSTWSVVRGAMLLSPTIVIVLVGPKVRSNAVRPVRRLQPSAVPRMLKLLRISHALYVVSLTSIVFVSAYGASLGLPMEAAIAILVGGICVQAIAAVTTGMAANIRREVLAAERDAKSSTESPVL